jgi:hypothetical protein
MVEHAGNPYGISVRPFIEEAERRANTNERLNDERSSPVPAPTVRL